MNFKFIIEIIINIISKIIIHIFITKNIQKKYLEDSSKNIRVTIIKSILIAGIIASLSLGVFFTSWYITNELIISIVIGMTVHFIAMGFAWKLAKKIFG